MILQTQFDRTINLLNRRINLFPIVEELLTIYRKSELTFHCFDKPSLGTEKKHLLNIYEVRAKIETNRKEGSHVFGYDTLLPKLRQTKQEHICISSFSTTVGTFIIFSDFERKDLIGVLFSKTTLKEIKDKINEHKDKIEANCEVVQYDYSKNENVFINGELQTRI